MRDNYLCAKCGRPAEEVHHKIHLDESNINDLKVCLNPDNLICLCKECHFKQHVDDKFNGMRKKQASKDNYKYEFDENGYLIEKGIPTLNK